FLRPCALRQSADASAPDVFRCPALRSVPCCRPSSTRRRISDQFRVSGEGFESRLSAKKRKLSFRTPDGSGLLGFVLDFVALHFRGEQAIGNGIRGRRGRAQTCGFRAQAELLERERVKLASGIQAVG